MTYYVNNHLKIFFTNLLFQYYGLVLKVLFQLRGLFLNHFPAFVLFRMLTYYFLNLLLYSFLNLFRSFHLCPLGRFHQILAYQLPPLFMTYVVYFFIIQRLWHMSITFIFNIKIPPNVFPTTFRGNFYLTNEPYEYLYVALFHNLLG